MLRFTINETSEKQRQLNRKTAHERSDDDTLIVKDVVGRLIITMRLFISAIIYNVFRERANFA